MTRRPLVLGALAVASAVPLARATPQEPIGLDLFIGSSPRGAGFQTVEFGRALPLWVETTRPAFVAIFQVTPRGDLRLLRPFYLRETFRTGRGMHFAAVDPFRPYWSPAGLGVGTVFAIASDEPITLSHELAGVGLFARRFGAMSYSIFNAAYHGWDIVEQVREAVAPGAGSEVAVVDYLAFQLGFQRSPLPPLRLPAFIASYGVAALPDGGPPAPEPRERERWRPREPVTGEADAPEVAELATEGRDRQGWRRSGLGEHVREMDGMTIIVRESAPDTWRRWSDGTGWRSAAADVWGHRSRWSSGTGLSSSDASWSASSRGTPGNASGTSWRPRGSRSGSSSAGDGKRSWTRHRDD